MNGMDKSFKNASVVLTGGACMVILVNLLVSHASNYDQPLVPGWPNLSGLGIPMLSFWLGLLLRRKSRPRPWLLTAVILSVLLCLYGYLHELDFRWESLTFLYLAAAGAGYLAPPRLASDAGKTDGWVFLVLLLFSAFCFTAMAVVLGRLRWILGSYLPEHQEMVRLMTALAQSAEPFIMVIFLYFSLIFSFSRTGQWLGRRAWFRGIVSVPVLVTFIASVANLPGYYYPGYTSAGWIRLLVQPLTIYMAVILRRTLRKIIGKKKGVSWKEIFSI